MNWNVFFKGIWRDISRVALLIVMVTALFWLDTWLPKMVNEPALSPLLTSSALVLALAAMTHITRRILFPRLDMQRQAQQAVEHPIGAGLVFLGFCLIVATLVYSNVGMLR